MTTTVTLLGTAGGPMPKGSRAAPSNAVTVDGDTYVIDCGSGAGRQLVRAGIAPESVRAILVTHHHSDHNVDMGTLPLLFWGRLSRAVRVIGPPPIRRAMDGFLQLARYDIDIRVADEGRPLLDDLLEVTEFTADGVVHEDDKVRITAARVTHPPIEHAFAYRVDTADRSVVFSGDTTPCDAVVDLARGADTLVHEVFYEPALAAHLTGYQGSSIMKHMLESHTRVEDVGSIAQRAGVRTLVLNHFVPTNDDLDYAEWGRLAARGFDGEVVVGEDLMRV